MNQKPLKPKKKRRWAVRLRRGVLLGLALVVLGCAGWYGWDLLSQEHAVHYETHTAEVGSISSTLSFSGSLQLVDDRTYTAASAAVVREVYVSERDEVAPGDRLLRLSTGETLTADFAGRVNQLSVTAGDEVTAGASLLQLSDFRHLQVSIRVDEYDIAGVTVGTPCTVTTTATERSFPSVIASVNHISASAGNTAYYTATAYVDVDGDIYPGMQVTIAIPRQVAESVVTLPLTALTFSGDGTACVLRRESDGTMTSVPVETGVSDGILVELLSGVSAGETVYAVEETTAGETGLQRLLRQVFGSVQINEPATVSFSGKTRDTSGMPDTLPDALPEGMPDRMGGDLPGGMSDRMPSEQPGALPTPDETAAPDPSATPDATAGRDRPADGQGRPEGMERPEGAEGMERPAGQGRPGASDAPAARE